MEHTYKPSTITRAGMFAAILLLAEFAIFSMMPEITAYLSKSQSVTAGGISLPAHRKSPGFIIILVNAGLILMLLNTMTEAVRISDDGIERKTICGGRHLACGGIGGWRVLWQSGRGGITYTLEVEPKDKTLLKPVIISQAVKFDEAFKSWITAYPNLPSANSLMDEVMASPKFAEKAKDADYVNKVEAFVGSRFNISPEQAVQNYFAKSGL